MKRALIVLCLAALACGCMSENCRYVNETYVATEVYIEKVPVNKTVQTIGPEPYITEEYMDIPISYSVGEMGINITKFNPDGEKEIWYGRTDENVTVFIYLRIKNEDEHSGIFTVRGNITSQDRNKSKGVEVRLEPNESKRVEIDFGMQRGVDWKYTFDILPETKRVRVPVLKYNETDSTREVVEYESVRNTREVTKTRLVQVCG